MKVLHIGPIRNSSAGNARDTEFEVFPGLGADGPSRVIIGLARALAEKGVTVGVLSTKPFHEVSKKWGNIQFLQPYTGYKYNPFVRSEEWAARIERDFGAPDLVHFHDVYDLFSCGLAGVIRKKGWKYIVTPHGGLRKVSQEREAWKKKTANALFFRRYLRHAARIHALSESERADISVFDGTLKTEVLPNGVPAESLFYKDKFPRAEAPENGKITVGFLGQIYVKIKGIDLLLGAVKRLQENKEAENLKFVLVGPTPNKIDVRWMGKILSEIPRPEVLSLPGSKFGREKWEALSRFDVFVLPSRTEGMPLVALEAMACAKPCLFTEGSSMRRIIEEARGGWGCENTQDAVYQNLLEISRTPADKLKACGKNAWDYVEKNLTWDRVAARYLDMAKSALSEKPHAL